MHAGFPRLTLCSANWQRGRALIRRQAIIILARLHHTSVTVFRKHTAATSPARPTRHAPLHIIADSRSRHGQWGRYFVATTPANQASVWPSTVWPTKLKRTGGPHSHKPRRRRDRREKNSRRQLDSNTEAVRNANCASEHLCARPVVGVTDLLLRGTSIPAPALSTARSKGSSAQRTRRSYNLGKSPNPAPSTSTRSASPTHEHSDPVSPPLPRQSFKSPVSSAKSMVPKQALDPAPIFARQPPWHCALWRVLRYMCQPVKDAAATAFDLLKLVMPLPAHHALSQPALTAHNADKFLPQSARRLWPIAQGSLMELVAAQAREFPHGSAEAADAQRAFAGGWKLGRFAADKSLPQLRSVELMLAIRASHAAIMHASHCNSVALQVHQLPLCVNFSDSIVSLFTPSLCKAIWIYVWPTHRVAVALNMTCVLPPGSR